MDEDTDVHLRWNEHQTTLLSVFSSLIGNENLVDCTISAEGQHFKAHRVILSACSPYFELLFNEHCESNPIVILPDVEFQILKALLEYMYYGEIKVPEDKLSTVLELAESLQIKGLSSVSDSEQKNEHGPKIRSKSTIPCDQQGSTKQVHEPRYGSQEEQKETSSVHTSEKKCSKGIDPCLLATQKCDKNSSNHVSHEKTVDEAPTFQDISDAGPFCMFRCTSVPKTVKNSNSHVSRTSLNPVSDILDSRQLSGSSKVKIGEQSLLSGNANSTHLTGEKLRTLGPLRMCSERQATDLPQQIKREVRDDFSADTIEEIILNDDTDESDNLDSGGENRNTFEGLVRVTPEQSFSGQGDCNPEQYRNTGTYFVEQGLILPNQYRCDDCGRSYRYQRGLSRHLKYKCGKEPQFKCPLCPAKYFHKYHLRAHFQKFHPSCMV